MAKNKINRIKKRKSTFHESPLIKGVIIGLSVIIVAVVAIAIYLIISGGYVGKVDGSMIYNYEYEYFLYQDLGEEASSISFPDGATDDEKIQLTKEHWSVTDDSGKTVLEKVKEKALEDVKVYKASYQIAVKEGHALDSAKKKDLISTYDQTFNYYINMYAQSGQLYTREQAINDLVKTPMSYNQFKSFIIKQSTIQNYKDEVMKPTYDPSDEELEQYYEDNIADYRTVSITLLQFSKKDASGNTLSDTDLQAKEDKATGVLDQLNADPSDENVTALITANSEDPSVSSNSGKYDITGSSTTVENALRDFVLAKTDVTATFEKFETDNDIYLLRIDDIQTYDNSDDIKTNVKDSYIDGVITDDLKNRVDGEAKYDVTDIRNKNIDKIIN
ncbi:MAG: peptidyl-prolyl cis-trans isomerase, partial [Clostridiales bacterium]|nr:peptidyl-prolyl cis-trans isomerase [Clostridiales bacterium]